MWGAEGTNSVKLQGPWRARTATASSNSGLSAVWRATISTRAERYGVTVACALVLTGQFERRARASICSRGCADCARTGIGKDARRPGVNCVVDRQQGDVTHDQDIEAHTRGGRGNGAWSERMRRFEQRQQ